MHIEFAVLRFHLVNGNLGDSMFVRNSIMNEVNDSANLDAMLFCEFLKIWTSCHRAIFVHDFNDCSGR